MLGVVLGEMTGLALISSHRNGVSIADVVVRHGTTLFGDWRQQVDVMSCAFLLPAGAAAFVVTRRLGRR